MDVPSGGCVVYQDFLIEQFEGNSDRYACGGKIILGAPSYKS